MFRTPRPRGGRAAHDWDRGPPTSAEAVYQAYATRVYAVAYRMTMNEADAEAVVRTAIRRVARGPAPLEPRLYRVTVNAVLALRRRRGVTPVPGAAAPGGDRRVRLEAAIARLPPEYRDPFVLSDVERLSGAEVGDLLGLAAGVVQGRLHRARLMLCAALRTAG